jgi:hypothetical protein
MPGSQFLFFVHISAQESSPTYSISDLAGSLLLKKHDVPLLSEVTTFDTKLSVDNLWLRSTELK